MSTLSTLGIYKSEFFEWIRLNLISKKIGAIGNQLKPISFHSSLHYLFKRELKNPIQILVDKKKERFVAKACGIENS